MANILLSGPAGAGKSQRARELLAEADGPAVLADFQSQVAALTGAVRDADGRYPPRPEWILPLAEYVRRAVITGAVARDIAVIATNSDGDPDRRAFLLNELGEDATETVIDPGEETVRARLADPATGELSNSCEEAINRWYHRKRRPRSGRRR